MNGRLERLIDGGYNVKTYLKDLVFTVMGVELGLSPYGKNTLSVFENKALRGIFLYNRKKVTE
jgi:hypothetical protein